MIWLIGSNGMLGREIAGLLAQNGLDFVGTDLDVDITDLEQLQAFAEQHNAISWIINCSAYTAVDKAEAEPEKAEAINANGVGNIAKIASQLDCKIIHFSTDYVYDGTKEIPYTEDDLVNPQCVYGMSKLQGEMALLQSHDRYFIIRISWLYGIHGPNFVKTMLRLFKERDELNVVSDQVGCPTYTEALAENIIRLIRADSEFYGIYLYSDEGTVSWYDFAIRIKTLAIEMGLDIRDVTINPIPTEAYPLPATRPRNSRFDKTRIKADLNFLVNNWDENLRRFFKAATFD